MARLRILTALYLARMSVAALVAFSRDVESGMAADTADFPSPTPPLPTLHGDTNALEDVQKRFLHDLSLKDARDAARTTVELDLVDLSQYAVGRARLLPPEKQAAVLAAARFSQRKVGTQNKEPFSIRDGAVSGSVKARIFRKLVAAKHKKVFIYVQASADGGRTWQDVASDFKCTLLVNGLAAGTTYAFRFRAKVGSDMTDWSQTVTHLVK